MQPSEHPHLHLVGVAESSAAGTEEINNTGHSRRSCEKILFDDTGLEDHDRRTALKYVLQKTDTRADQIAEEDIALLRSEMKDLLSRNPLIKGLEKVLSQDDDAVVEFARAYLRPKQETEEKAAPENR